MSEFIFHPEAVKDLQEIWDYIAAENLEAADRVSTRSMTRSSLWCHSPMSVTHVLISPRDLAVPDCS